MSMLLEPQLHLSKNAVFAADRRMDVSVELNRPIATALGDEAKSITDFLTKSGAAVLEPYPGLSIKFSVGRMIAGGEGFIRQYKKLNTLAPSVEARLFDIMHSAGNWLKSFDELAFVMAYVTHKPQNSSNSVRRKKHKQQWWRCDG